MKILHKSTSSHCYEAQFCSDGKKIIDEHSSVIKTQFTPKQKYKLLYQQKRVVIRGLFDGGHGYSCDTFTPLKTVFIDGEEYISIKELEVVGIV